MRRGQWAVPRPLSRNGNKTRGRRTGWDLHREPVWLDAVVPEKVHDDFPVEMAGLDHLAEQEALGRCGFRVSMEQLVVVLLVVMP